jgi:hypothetical protein
MAAAPDAPGLVRGLQARAVHASPAVILDHLDGWWLRGEGVSGPAARRLIDSAREQHRRFGGLITTPRQAKALLEDPALTVFENPAAYLACNYDPIRALCNPASGPGRATRPASTGAGPAAPT